MSEKPERATLTLNIPPDLKEKIREEAEVQHRSLSQLAVVILKEYFEKLERKKLKDKDKKS